MREEGREKTKRREREQRRSGKTDEKERRGETEWREDDRQRIERVEQTDRMERERKTQSGEGEGRQRYLDRETDRMETQGGIFWPHSPQGHNTPHEVNGSLHGPPFARPLRIP